MATCLPCSKAEPDALLKAEREALQGEVEHLRRLVSLASISPNLQPSSRTCTGLAPSSSLSATLNASASSLSVVQLKREELLKWKAAQLERQVTMLQAALQVPFCKNNPYCDCQWYQHYL